MSASLREIGSLKDPLGVRGPLRPMAARGVSPEVTRRGNSAVLSRDPRERLAGRFDETPVALSEITHKTPFKPRPFNPLKKSSPAAKDSESPISRPRISRTPSSRMPVAMRAAFDTTRSSSRTAIPKASTHTNGEEAVRRRSLNARTRGSRWAQSALTVDFEKETPHKASVISVTLRVETPWTTIP